MSSYTNQILSTFSLCLIAISHGIVAAWTFPNYLMLSSANSPFTLFGILPHVDSKLDSVCAVGSAICGSIVAAIVSQFWGRKKIFYFMGLPHISYWILMLIVDNQISLYVQHILAGFSIGCIYITVTATITEFGSTKIRGNLGTMFATGQNLGLLLGSLAATYVETFSASIYFFIILPVIFMLVMIPFPETPHDLLRRGLDEKAIKSIRFYKNLKNNTDPEILNDMLVEMKANLNTTEQNGKITWSDFTSKEYISTFLQAVFILSFYLGNGSYVVINVVSNYCLDLYDSGTVGALILCTTHLAASIAANCFSHLYPRKYCLAVSSFLGGLLLCCAGILSVYYKKIEMKSTIIMLLNLSEFSLQFGVNSLSHLIVAELMPLKTKNITLGVVYSIAAIIGFLFTIVFPSLLFNSETGVLAALFICGSLCFTATCFYLSVLTETSGKNIF